MRHASPALSAAISAIRGESDLAAIHAAFGTWRIRHVLALADSVDPVVRVFAAISSGLRSLLDSQTIADPAVDVAVQRRIGTIEGYDVLASWADVAPVGWGADHAAPLIDAVWNGVCPPSAAAKLIGPCDESAALLLSPDAIASVIRHWGQTTPNDPTAWISHISARITERLFTLLRSSPECLSMCLPWLPTDAATGETIGKNDVVHALNAFASASPISRMRHEKIVRRIVALARPDHLDALTRLASVLACDDAWITITRLLQEVPDAAQQVVSAAPWHAIQDKVQTTILACADRSNVCAAVAVARGCKTNASFTHEAAIAFFAALDPDVWDALDQTTRRRWFQTIARSDCHLAVRSLGIRADVLMRTWINDALVVAVRRHACDMPMVRRTLLPVALRDVDLDDVHAIIAALPDMPDDPATFVRIVCECNDGAAAQAAGASALRTPADLAVAVTLQRVGSGGTSTHTACKALSTFLHGWTWDALSPILATLSAAAHDNVIPDHDMLARRLAHPERCDQLRQNIARIASLPPDIALPALFALKRCGEQHSRRQHQRDAGTALASALQNHGDVVVHVVDALDDHLRRMVLPLPKCQPLAAALRSLLQDDPESGMRLAHTLSARDWQETILALLTTPPRHVGAIWRTLPDATRRAIRKKMQTIMQHADLPAGIVAAIAASDPVAATAIAALYSDDPDVKENGMHAMIMRPSLTRALLPHLPLHLQDRLWTHPVICAAVADLYGETSVPDVSFRLSKRR